MLSAKSKGENHNLLEEKDLDKYETWARADEPAGTLPVPSASIYRSESRTAWLHVGEILTKALTKDQDVWLGSIYGKFRPYFNIYNYPVRHGWISITTDAQNPGQSNIMFTPNADYAIGKPLFIDVVYIARSE